MLESNGSPVLGERIYFAGFQQKFNNFNMTYIENKQVLVLSRN